MKSQRNLRTEKQPFSVLIGAQPGSRYGIALIRWYRSRDPEEEGASRAGTALALETDEGSLVARREPDQCPDPAQRRAGSLFICQWARVCQSQLSEADLDRQITRPGGDDVEVQASPARLVQDLPQLLEIVVIVPLGEILRRVGYVEGELAVRGLAVPQQEAEGLGLWIAVEAVARDDVVPSTDALRASPKLLCQRVRKR